MSLPYDVSNPPMMGCGHAANATTKQDGVDIPCCVICAGLDPGALVIVDTPPNLEGRMARCTYDGTHVGLGHEQHSRYDKPKEPQPSDPSLAFFAYRPDETEDRFYCGCWGWN